MSNLQIEKDWRPNFYLLWTGQAISRFTSAVLQLALVWYLTDVTGSAYVLGAAFVAAFLPQAIIGPFAGVIVDRMHRKAVLIGADVFIAVGAAILLIASRTFEVPPWLVVLVLMVRSIGDAFSQPAITAVTPLLAPKDRLLSANGLTQAFIAGTYVLSPAAGAVVYAQFGVDAAILVDIIGCLLAVIIVLMVKIPDHRIAPDRSPSSSPGVWVELKDGLEELRRFPGFIVLLAIMAIFMFVIMPMNALFPLMSMDYFGGTAYHASVVEIAFAVGMLIGGAYIGARGHRYECRIFFIILSILGVGVPSILIGLQPPTFVGFIVFCSASGLMGISWPFFNTPVMALYQEHIAPEKLGRVLSLNSTVSVLAIAPGMLVGSWVAETVGLSTWFIVAGVVVSASSIVALRSKSLRALDTPSSDA